jgi:peptide/nickel transport system substrate-binding protein
MGNQGPQVTPERASAFDNASCKAKLVARSWRRHRFPLAVIALLSIVGSCTVGAAAVARVSNTKASGTVTSADQQGAQPTYILPFLTAPETNIGNLQAIYMLWRPLYWFGVGKSTEVNTKLSLADLPQVSNDGKTFTITLKSYNSSDGQPVTSRDIPFFWNLLRANKSVFGNYQPGQIPDDVTSHSAHNANTFVLTFDQAFNARWILEASDVDPWPAACNLPGSHHGSGQR